MSIGQPEPRPTATSEYAPSAIQARNDMLIRDRGRTDQILRELLALSPWNATSEDIQSLQRRARLLLGEPE